MKIAAVGTLWLCVFYHLITVGNLEKQTTLLKHEATLHKTEAQILRDQVADMTYQFSSRKTYEEGVADGVDRSKNEDWVAGYHFCCEQFGMGKDLISKNK